MRLKAVPLGDTETERWNIPRYFTTASQDLSGIGDEFVPILSCLLNPHSPAFAGMEQATVKAPPPQSREHANSLSLEVCRLKSSHLTCRHLHPAP